MNDVSDQRKKENRTGWRGSRLLSPRPAERDRGLAASAWKPEPELLGHGGRPGTPQAQRDCRLPVRRRYGFAGRGWRARNSQIAALASRAWLTLPMTET
jgi:hypothetical protein